MRNFLKKKKNTSFNSSLSIGVLLISLYTGCSGIKKNESTTIIPLSPYLHEDTIENNNRMQHLRVEFYLVTNATTDTAILKSQIQKFSRDKLIDIVNSSDRLERIFYKESNKTKRNYIQSDKDIIESHHKDVIAEEHWINKGEVYFIEFYENGDLLTNEKPIKISEE
jgi:hypothetical protein